MKNKSNGSIRARKRCVGSSFIADLLGVPTSTVLRWSRLGMLPPPLVGVGTHRRWDRAAIRRFAAEHGIPLPAEEVPV
jgi:hypothetical protein